jgi:predicted SAM-dependent methyltransferase
MEHTAKDRLKSVLPSGLWRFSKKMYYSSLYKKTRGKVKEILKENKTVWLEIGAGDVKGKNGWTSMDINKACDLVWDLRNGIPFPDASIQKIYSSHLFEHLYYKDIESLLGECKRVLIPGGLFLICVPNARLYIEAYLNKDEKFWASIPKPHWPAYNKTTSIDYLNYMAYMDDEHKYMFDEENLLFILKKNGFEGVKTRPFDPAIDKKERDFESLYAQATKPA